MERGDLVFGQPFVAFFPGCGLGTGRLARLLNKHRVNIGEFAPSCLELAAEKLVNSSVEGEFLVLVGENSHALSADEGSSVCLPVLDILAHLT